MRQLFQYHPIIGYHFIPCLRARLLHESGGYHLRVNAAGFRSDREFVHPRNANKKRILVFGDSFTAGDGVSNEKRYTDRLEALIPDLEVYNFGFSASATDQHYLCYREFARDIEHDLIIAGIYVDNVRRLHCGYRPFIDESRTFTVYEKPYFELTDGQLQLRNVPVPRLSVEEADLSPESSAALRRVKFRGHAVTNDQPVPEYNSPDHPAWRLMHAILAQWIRDSLRPVLLLPIPLYQFTEGYCDPAPYLDRFRELSEETGCFWHNLLEDLQGYSAAERRAFRYPWDIHPTPAGHAAIAQSLERPLRRILRMGGDSALT